MARTPKIVEDRREQIIDAAMRVFAQKGFTKATNKDIAREAGITPGLIYYYFESKEAVLNAIIEMRTPVQLLSALPPEALALPVGVFLKMLAQRVLEIVESENFVGLIRVMLPEVIHNPAMAPIPLAGFQRVFAFLTGYFEAKVAAGELRPVDAAMIAQVLFGSMIGFVLRRQILRDPAALEFTHEQIADAIVDTMLNGTAAR
ncbi:MAG TPA: TetR/AcrR family transcriptional regulator [Ktedonobacteraceae bacterium]|nr:TetR/AcrR family transcriptional regulator [Ktedonobacteraceae bacterium]